MLFEDRRLLFVDGLDVERMEGVTLRLNPPEKCGPCLLVEHPWEKRVTRASVVFRWKGLWRMYYAVVLSEWTRAMALAVSEDGVTWERPQLGAVEFLGSTANNLVDIQDLRPDEMCVFVDPNGPEEERIKFVGEWPYVGMWVMTSADGVRFKRAPGEILRFHLDNHMSVFWDPEIRKYRIYCRGNDAERPIPPAKGSRMVVYAETEDIFQPIPVEEDRPDRWPPGMRRPGPGGSIIEPLPPINRELPAVLKCDEQDPPECDLYQSVTIHYAPAVYLSFPSIYYHYPAPPEGFINDGVIDVQFSASRDGVHWDRSIREPYVRLDLEGGRASRQIHMLIGAVPGGHSLYQYYCGWDRTHGQDRTPDSPRPKHPVEVGDPIAFRLRQRLDGFVSADSDYAGGELVTRPFEVSGETIAVNIDTSASGCARAALLGEDGRELEGYGLADSDLLHANDTAHILSWRKSPDVSRLRGRPVRLLLRSRATKLYAVYPAGPPRPAVSG